MTANVGTIDRALRIVVGLALGLLAAALPAPAADRLSAWLGRVAKGDDPSLHRSLRHLLQLLSTRISIAEAFP